MKQRHQLLSQANIYLKQNPENANLTAEELKEMIGHMCAIQLMNRVQRCAAKVQGTSQYWYQRCQELQALIEQKGPPTLFWTVSAADSYWPDLHRLISDTPNPTNGQRFQEVIKRPHLMNWFFTSRLDNFIKLWLVGTINAAMILDFVKTGAFYVQSLRKRIASYVTWIPTAPQTMWWSLVETGMMRMIVLPVAH